MNIMNDPSSRAKTEIVQNNHSPEAHLPHEVLNRTPRIVIYGQLGPGYQGTLELSDMLGAYVREHGMSEQGIVAAREYSNIENAFYRGRRQPPLVKNALPAPEAKNERNGRLQRFLGSLARADQVLTPREVPQLTERDVEDTIPLAVFVLPEMRDHSGSGARTLDTPVDEIEELCRRHDVPMIRIERSTTQNEVAGALKELPAASITPTETK